MTPAEFDKEAEDPRIRRLPATLNFAGLADVLYLQRTAVYEVISRPDFPAPTGLGGRKRLWNTAEVLAWLDRQPRVRDRVMPESLAPVRRFQNGHPVGCKRKRMT
jgi:predicted DNA-binding transcriptional regulator AlpA